MLCGDLNGKEIQKKGRYIYIYIIDSLCQKLTNIVKQLYSNKNLKKEKKNHGLNGAPTC